MTVSAGIEELSFAYEEAELRIIDLIASRLKKGAEAPDWAVRKLQELALTKRQIKKELDKLAPEALAQVSRLLQDNYERGQAEALDTLIRSKMATPYPGVIQASREMSKLLTETTQSILESHNRILRSTDDAYRKIVSRAASDLLLGTGTRSDMIQRGLNEFADKGVTGFVDKKGRNWEMKAYVEMAAGTAAHRASTQGHLEKLKENGHNLVVVSDHKGECDLCRKWEGEVLAIEPVQDTPEPTPQPVDVPQGPTAESIRDKALKQMDEMGLKKTAKDFQRDYDKAMKGDKDALQRLRFSGFVKADDFDILKSATEAGAPAPKKIRPSRFSADEYKPLDVSEYTDTLHRYEDRKPAAVKEYEGNGYQAINIALRDGADLSDTMRLEDGSRASIASVVKKIDAEMNKGVFKTSAPSKVYRGLGNVDHIGQPGEFLVEAGYTSTTASETVADGFRRASGWSAQINIPPGVKYLPGKSAEREMILPRNTTYRVISRNEDTRELILEVVEFE